MQARIVDTARILSLSGCCFSAGSVWIMNFGEIFEETLIPIDVTKKCLFSRIILCRRANTIHRCCSCYGPRMRMIWLFFFKQVTWAHVLHAACLVGR